jgi:fumiquinazoline A oxidase
MKTSLIAAILMLLSKIAAINITALFEPHLSPGADIFYYTDPNWTTEVIQRWTYYEAPAYYAAIKPATPADVQAIVSYLDAKTGV